MNNDKVQVVVMLKRRGEGDNWNELILEGQITMKPR